MSHGVSVLAGFTVITTVEWTAAKATGGLNEIAWYQIFALHYVVGKAKTYSAHMEAS